MLKPCIGVLLGTQCGVQAVDSIIKELIMVFLFHRPCVTENEAGMLSAVAQGAADQLACEVDQTAGP